MRMFMEYKTKILIEKILREKLESERKLLIFQQSDKNCPIQVYENTLDMCGELEYAIKQMETIK
tara:strand:+ start:1230 stop:1421 length:192 start_codon:yes stop_codon:yes gene_type:complete